jgi:hypothetical protein
MIRSYLRLLKVSVFLSLLLPIIVAVSSILISDARLLQRFSMKLVIGAIFMISAGYGISRLLRNLKDSFDNASEKQASFLDGFDDRFVGAAIFISAALSLFLELSVIRWQSAVFPIFAFYKNFSLLACFAGLGLGYALAREKGIPLFLSIPVMAFQMVLLTFLRNGFGEDLRKSLMATPFIEQLNMGFAVGTSLPYLFSIYFFLLVVFLLTALVFIPVGQVCGRVMGRQENLRSYGFNLLGSVLGVVFISGVSFLWLPPVVWFAVCFIMILAFQVFDQKTLFMGSFFSFFAVIILALPIPVGLEKIYSPYQLLERGKGEYGLMMIQAAGHYYQRVHDLSAKNANLSTDKYLKSIADYYELPYRVYAKKPEHVVIVGSGTGNDVAAALRMGTSNVEAIEIDPAIKLLGLFYHPEKPYSNPHVKTVINDARTFLRTTDQKYDMVVYGLLDSHTLLSHASSVRLDSFVYTVEGLQEARERLNEGGMLSLSFSVLSDEIGRKIYLMMKEVFEGRPPVCVKANYDGSVIFMQGRDEDLSIDSMLLMSTGFEDVTDFYADPLIEADISTDDWPFFYMPHRVYPLSYLGILLLLVILSPLVTANFFGQNFVLSNPAFFFLGAGFMLIETKGITELGLIFGNTWHVIGIVISGILLMAFLANAFVYRYKISRPLIPFVLLVLSLLAGYIIAKQGGFGSSMAGKASATILLTSPMFFSGMVFSSLLSRAKDITGVMAINLIGAMLGGVLEYNSMYFGFSFLYLLAIFLYVLAMVSFYFIRA